MPKDYLEINKFQTGIITTPSETDIPPDAASDSLNIDPINEDGVLVSIPEDGYLNIDGYTDSKKGITEIDKSNANFIILTTSSNHNLTDKFIGQLITISGVVTTEPTPGQNINRNYSIDSYPASNQIKMWGKHSTGGTLSYTNATWGFLGFVGQYSNFKIFNHNQLEYLVGYNKSLSSITVIEDLKNSNGSISPFGRFASQASTTQSATKDSITIDINNRDSYIGLGGSPSTPAKWLGKPKHKQFQESLGWSSDNAKLDIPSQTPMFNRFIRLYNTTTNQVEIIGFEFQSNIIYKYKESNATELEKHHMVDFDQLYSITHAGQWIFILEYSSYEGNNGLFYIHKLHADNLSSIVHTTLVPRISNASLYHRNPRAIFIQTMHESKSNSTGNNLSSDVGVGYFSNWTMNTGIILNLTDTATDGITPSSQTISSHNNDGDFTASGNLAGGTANTWSVNDRYAVVSPKLWVVYGWNDIAEVEGTYDSSNSGEGYTLHPRPLFNYDWHTYTGDELEEDVTLISRSPKLAGERATASNTNFKVPARGDFCMTYWHFTNYHFDCRQTDWAMKYRPEECLVGTRDVSKIGFISKYHAPTGTIDDVGEFNDHYGFTLEGKVIESRGGLAYHDYEYTWGLVATEDNPKANSGTPGTAGAAESGTLQGTGDGWKGYYTTNPPSQGGGTTEGGHSIPLHGCTALYGTTLNIISNTHTHGGIVPKINLSAVKYDTSNDINLPFSIMTNLVENRVHMIVDGNSFYNTPSSSIDLSVEPGDYKDYDASTDTGGAVDTNPFYTSGHTTFSGELNTIDTNLNRKFMNMCPADSNGQWDYTRINVTRISQSGLPNLAWIPFNFTSSTDLVTLIKDSGTNELINGGNVTFTVADSGGGSTFDASLYYFYRVSCMYDGFQESPLSAEIDNGSNLQTAQNRTITLKILNASVIRPRLSHINIYRAKGGTATREDESYRLVKSVSLNSGAWVINGDGRDYVYTDTNTSEASYEAINNISEELEHTTVNYSLSTVVNNCLMVADAWVDGIEDASSYIFQSEPGNYSQFNWSKNYLILEESPIALSSFQGKLFAFTKSKTYTINPSGMYVEDVFDGVGCIGPKAVAVSEFGMCFADANNIYLHDGRKPIPIGDGILRGNDFAWQNKKLSSEHYFAGEKGVKVAYFGKTGSYLIIFRDSNDNTKCLVYTLKRKRWDLWEIPNIYSLSPTGDGKLILACENNLINYQGHSSNKRSWSWTSKKFNFGQVTQLKKLKKLNISSKGDISSENVDLKLNNSSSTTTSNTISYGGSYYQEEYSPSGNKDFYNAQVIFSEITGTKTVDGFGLLFRKKPPK